MGLGRLIGRKSSTSTLTRVNRKHARFPKRSMSLLSGRWLRFFNNHASFLIASWVKLKVHFVVRHIRHTRCHIGGFLLRLLLPTTALLLLILPWSKSIDEKRITTGSAASTTVAFASIASVEANERDNNFLSVAKRPMTSFFGLIGWCKI